MPDEAVAHDEHVVPLAELDIAVGALEVIPLQRRMDSLPLQVVFRSDGIELGLYERAPAVFRPVYCPALSDAPIRKSFWNASFRLVWP